MDLIQTLNLRSQHPQNKVYVGTAKRNNNKVQKVLIKQSVETQIAVNHTIIKSNEPTYNILYNDNTVDDKIAKLPKIKYLVMTVNILSLIVNLLILNKGFKNAKIINITTISSSTTKNIKHEYKKSDADSLCLISPEVILFNTIYTMT